MLLNMLNDLAEATKASDGKKILVLVFCLDVADRLPVAVRFPAGPQVSLKVW